MVLFWTVFDSIISYITPVVITNQGFSETMMGVIYASSSVAGGFFDFFIGRLFKNIHYRRVFLMMFVLCMIYPLVLWQAKTVWMFFLAMGIWGVYWDLYGFGSFDFISRFAKTTDNSKDFGILSIFHSVGALVAVLITGVVVGEIIDWKVYSFSWLFLLIAIAFFVILLVITKKIHPLLKQIIIPKKRNFFVELHLWKKIGKQLLPVLFLSFFIFFMEAFFWTLAPIFGEQVNFTGFGGFLLVADTVPVLITGWFIGSITHRFGKKRTAILALLVGSFILAFFNLIHQPIFLIILTFTSALFVSICLPAISGAYADYISEDNNEEGEIEGLEDFSFNLGYILGPLFAGLCADLLGIPLTFSLLGVAGVMVALFLLKFTPRHIRLKAKSA